MTEVTCRCGAEIPRVRNETGRLSKPRTCSPECRKAEAIASGRRGGKQTASDPDNRIQVGRGVR